MGGGIDIHADWGAAVTLQVAVLGETGVTGKAVLAAVDRLADLQYQPDVHKADWIVASPGISPDDFPKVSVPIMSEIEFAYRLFHRSGSEYCPKLIGITGTNGKTTVTEMLSFVTGFPACGNIGLPLVTYVDHPDRPEWLVVELSSYQLETCTQFRPEIAILTNITPDHLQRHHTMSEYGQQKAKIFTAQRPDDAVIYFESDPEIQPLVPLIKSRAIPYSERSPEMADIRSQLHLPGRHNALNALAVSKAAVELGIPVADTLVKLKQFKLAEHRLELVAVVEGVSYINDSKSTNPDATMVAVTAFERSHVLICGKDKALDLAPLIRFLSQHAKSVIVFGEIADRYVQTAKTLGLAGQIRQVSDMAAAVALAHQMARPKDTVLLSPACSSFDQFDNYEHRGQVFKDEVTKLASQST